MHMTTARIFADIDDHCPTYEVNRGRFFDRYGREAMECCICKHAMHCDDDQWLSPHECATSNRKGGWVCSNDCAAEWRESHWEEIEEWETIRKNRKVKEKAILEDFLREQERIFQRSMEKWNAIDSGRA